MNGGSVSFPRNRIYFYNVYFDDKMGDLSMRNELSGKVYPGI